MFIEKSSLTSFVNHANRQYGMRLTPTVSISKVDFKIEMLASNVIVNSCVMN